MFSEGAKDILKRSIRVYRSSQNLYANLLSSFRHVLHPRAQSEIQFRETKRTKSLSTVYKYSKGNNCRLNTCPNIMLDCDCECIQIQKSDPNNSVIKRLPELNLYGFYKVSFYEEKVLTYLQTHSLATPEHHF
jgi:hypothetical protein